MITSGYSQKSQLHDPLKHLFLHNFNTFKGGGGSGRGWGDVSHSNTVHLTVTLCKTDHPYT